MKRLFIASVALAFFVIGATAQTVPIPASDQILGTLKKSHPRLLVSQDDFARLQLEIKTNTLQGQWYQRIEKRAEGILSQPPSTYEIPDGLRLLATSRRVLDRVYTLGLVYRVSHEQRFADRMWTELDTAAHFPDWNHRRHFLDTAEMTHAFAIAYDWLYDTWTPQQRMELRQAIADKGLQPGLEILRKKSWWAVARHNWNQVCNGGLGMGALAIADEQPELAAELLEKSLHSIQLAMAEFAPDGAWGEGPGYWDYATHYNVTILAGLDSALGTDFGLSKFQGFSETGTFPLYIDGPAGHSFNFADGGDSIVRGAQLFWLARKFNRPEFAVFERTATKASPQDLIWFDQRGDSNSIKALPLDRYLHHVEIAVMRSDWQNPDAIYVGLKAGGNAVNHSHLDLGSFVLDALGERWAIDFGHEDYNLPGYFGRERWTYYRLRAEGHNTLLINPSAAPDQDPRAESKITRFASTPERAFAITDLTAAYGTNADKVQRGIAMLDRKQVLVQDEIKAVNPADVWWFLHTQADIAVDGRSAVLKIGDKQMSAKILSPETATFTVMNAEPLPNSPHPPKQGNNGKYKKLTVHLTDVKDLRLAILLTPGLDADSSKLDVTALEKW